jgi:hypothetical protein
MNAQCDLAPVRNKNLVEHGPPRGERSTRESAAARQIPPESHLRQGHA